MRVRASGHLRPTMPFAQRCLRAISSRGPRRRPSLASVIPATAEETGETELDDGLPRRVRQASLAPQLRETPARPGPSADLGVLAEPPPTEWSAAERERSALSYGESGETAEILDRA